MAVSLRRVKVAPKGMGLNDFVAMQEGFFAAEGLTSNLTGKRFCSNRAGRALSISAPAGPPLHRG
jgi:hypothetical protein